MAEPLIDEISPRYVREKRLDLTLDPGAVVRAGSSILVNVSYTRALPEGVMLPLVLEIQGPSAGSYQRREYTAGSPPVALIFTPREGGPHLVALREVGHNKWWGSLNLDVDGELLEPPKPV